MQMRKPSTTHWIRYSCSLTTGSFFRYLLTVLDMFISDL